MQRIVLPDVEELAVSALNRSFPVASQGFLPTFYTVAWATKIPNPRPGLFGRVILSGGNQETIVTDQVSLLVEGWGGRESEAHAVCSIARSILLGLEGQLFGGYTISTPVNLPDPRTAQYRYTTMIGLRVRAQILGSN